jgi:hypothetical protein
MSSIVLNQGVKEMLLSDTRDFLKSEKVSIPLLGILNGQLTSSSSGTPIAASHFVVGICCMVFQARARVLSSMLSPAS